jgi:hypothetical protein
MVGIRIRNYLAQAKCRMCAEGNAKEKPCLSIEMGETFRANLCAAHVFALAELHDESSRLAKVEPAVAKAAIPSPIPAVPVGNGPMTK